MSEHTKGPWITIDNPTNISIATGQYIEGGRQVAFVHRSKVLNGESIANSRLIAAAPELLEAIKVLLPEGWGDDDIMDHIPGVKLARLAIAKAEGL